MKAKEKAVKPSSPKQQTAEQRRASHANSVIELEKRRYRSDCEEEMMKHSLQAKIHSEDSD